MFYSLSLLEQIRATVTAKMPPTSFAASSAPTRSGATLWQKAKWEPMMHTPFTRNAPTTTLLRRFIWGSIARAGVALTRASSTAVVPAPSTPVRSPIHRKGLFRVRA